ncbi:MAG: hypothetical protein KDK76_03445 [Chlamydiia bacterium]|nr:hypothetical protein [Chlamydiia bacterium]
MDKKIKEGVSVQEIENFGKKYRFEIFFVLYFLIATLLTFIFFSAAWSVFLAGVGGILGVWLPNKIEKAARAAFRFVFKQEKATKLVLAIVGVIIAFFLPPLVFFFLGLMGGSGMNKAASAVTKLGDKEGGQ